MNVKQVGRSNFSDIDIEESTDYYEQVQSLKQIALQHISAISRLIAQELTPGYWEKKPIKVAAGVIMAEKYHPDLMIGYCNAVDFLVDIVYPFSDKDYEDFINPIYESEDNNELEIKERIKIRKKMFRQTIKMFERVNFFDSTSGVTE